MYVSTGLAWDLLFSNALWMYEKFDFDIPVGIRGDCYDRYLIRIEEMRQSINIIMQAIAYIPTNGPVRIDNSKIMTPSER